MGWEKDSELRMKDLWRHPDFKSAHLPKSPWAPRWPILCPEEGVFYMTIGDFYGDDDESGDESDDDESNDESDEEEDTDESDKEEDTSAGGGLHSICITMWNDKLFSVSS
ncbi:hypothetical protein U9M48_041607 [Paspalum notatum var. saurae]|uniref:Uncharacterized protein n=1 Tax=Paspalum notatum var. saurae TaxID=547442 RepID=A0AAQ3UTB7_PASNO